MSDSIIAVAGLITVAVITPGPNNLIVLSAAARGGFISALSAITGVITGTWLLVTLLLFWGSTIFDIAPWLQPTLLYCGITYLLWMGVTLALTTDTSNISNDNTARKINTPGVVRMLFLQFLYPKGWILVMVATSAFSAEPDHFNSWLVLSALFIFIPAICLSIWALAVRFDSTATPSTRSFYLVQSRHGRAISWVCTGTCLSRID